MSKIKGNINPFLWILIFIPYILLIIFFFLYKSNQKEKLPVALIVIDKSEMLLKAYDKNGRILQKSFIAIGKGNGNKEKKGDMKTPEGVFTVADIQDASNWSHDFKDDSLGLINGAYGPVFIRLNVPGYSGIGIHGTHDPNSIGKKVTEGCIRLRNEEVKMLSTLIEPGAFVVILPSKDDILINKN